MSPVRRLAWIAALSGIVFGAGALSAQVFEIDGDGAVTVHDGAAVTTLDGVTPILASDGGPSAPKGDARSPFTAAPSSIEGIIRLAARDYGIAPDLIRAVAWHESRYRQNAISSKGAIGVMQLMPATARTLGVDPFDIEQNIRGGAAFLSQLNSRFRGDLKLTLAAYSAGPGAVDRFGGVPPYAETQAYVADILQKLGLAGRFAAN